MSLDLQQHKKFKPRSGPVLLVVLDGIGIAPPGPANAIHLANTPTLDALFKSCPLQGELLAHGRAVGLPADTDIGNSEVGHNAPWCRPYFRSRCQVGRLGN